MHNHKRLLLLDAALLGSCLGLYLGDRFTPFVSLLGFTLTFLLWQIATVVRAGHNLALFPIEGDIRKAHYIQTAVQASLYAYLGLYGIDLWHWMPLILVQVLFAYALQAGLAWSRGRSWRLGFGPVPIVGSINLFPGFREEYFYLQLLLVAIAFLGKEFITWEREGHRRHIFNPSAFALAAAALLVMLTDSVYLSNGADLVHAFLLPPNFFELLFLVGIIVQFFFATTLITFGATLALTVIFFGLKLAVGHAITPGPIDIAVFLGINLLITDPATSPRSRTGKFLFGLAYGMGVEIAYCILRLISQPSYYDKILIVPILNVLVVHFDVIGSIIHERAVKIWPAVCRLESRLVHFGLYIILFLLIINSLKFEEVDVRDPFPPNVDVRSPEMLEKHVKATIFRNVYRKDVFPPHGFGFLGEIKHYSSFVELSHDTPESHTWIGIAYLDAFSMPQEALPHLERALELNPQYTRASDALRRARQALQGRGRLHRQLPVSPAN